MTTAAAHLGDASLATSVSSVDGGSDRVAEALVQPGYFDIGGNWHDVDVLAATAVRAILASAPATEPLWFVPYGHSEWLWSPCRIELEDGTHLGEHAGLPADLPIGYHRLVPVDGGPTTLLIVHPTRCPDAPSGWGVAAQVYALTAPVMSATADSGIGGFAEVHALIDAVADAGGAVVQLSPLHAPTPSLPQEDSPYYPSSRRWLNPLLIDTNGEPVSTSDAVVRVPNTHDRSTESLIDRDVVWAAKRSELRAYFADVAERPEHPWRTWAAAQPGLHAYAAWTAQHDQLSAQSIQQVDRSVADEGTQTAQDFHAFLQWVAHQQWARVREHARQRRIHLVTDLAVGCRPDGAEAAADEALLAAAFSVGAPPDPFNASGQSWGLPPYSPTHLRAAHYEPFVDMLRAAMNGVGGVRIDHVLGLFRQYWVPRSGSPTSGVYVRQFASELLALVCLEATRAGCFVIGEDLGTVEPEVRSALAEANILGTTVLWFEPDPSTWRTHAVSSATTHDLPTITGVAHGTDGSPDMRELLTHISPQAGGAAQLVAAVHRRIANAGTRITLLTLEDLAASPDRPNHPGTLAHERPNWRRRLPPIDEIDIQAP
jgi:4-alpha-glucanotransferase